VPTQNRYSRPGTNCVAGYVGINRYFGLIASPLRFRLNHSS
jgi:hypothetical protein